MQVRSTDIRRLLGCGYEPPADRAEPWAGLGYKGTAPTTCPGYTTTLPEVAEVNRAHFHWSKGNLIALHREPTDALLRGIEVLDMAHGAATSWAMTPAKDGGGLGDR